jgi:hypothetical protein
MTPAVAHTRLHGLEVTVSRILTLFDALTTSMLPSKVHGASPRHPFAGCPERLAQDAGVPE